jgi:diguanylate cyclase (GGDEF)-like protein
MPASVGKASVIWIFGSLGCVVIGMTDYASGVELRVFPLYYAPIAFIAWHQGRAAALIAAIFCGGLWMVSNIMAGLHYSRAWIWMGNVIVQTTSFAIVGLLIARLRDALSRERDISRTDGLTGLLNGRAFQEEGLKLLAQCRRKRQPVGIAYIDLDRFKDINDREGHAAGDAVLQRVADLLRTSTRPGDLVTRLGGDEFALLVAEAGPQEFTALLERLRTGLSRLTSPAGSTLSGSVGALTFSSPPGDFGAMIKRADACMYGAKTEGRNRVRLEPA